MLYCVQASNEEEARVRERGVGYWHHWGESNHARRTAVGIKEELLDSSLSFTNSAHLFQKDTSFPKEAPKTKEFKRCPTAFLKSHHLPKKQI